MSRSTSTINTAAVVVASSTPRRSTCTSVLVLFIILSGMMTDCEGIRGRDVANRQHDLLRRAAEFNIQHNYLYNSRQADGSIAVEGGRDEDTNNAATEILHFNAFPFAQENVIDLNASEDDPKHAKKGGSSSDNKSKGAKSKKSKKKSPKKSKSVLKHFYKRPYKVMKTKKTYSPMPTVSSAPSSMPSVSSQPTVTAAPTPSPTRTNQPSSSRAPSSQAPATSPYPGVVARPPTTTAATNVATGDTVTTEQPVVATTTTTTTPAPNTNSVPKVEVMNKFALGYHIPDNDATAVARISSDHYSALAKTTGWYIRSTLTANFQDSPTTDFVDAEIVSYYEPSPLVVDYDALSSFAETSPSFPTQDQMDGILGYAFTTMSADYVNFLSSNLPSENPFANTVSVSYSTYWEALAASQEDDPTRTTVPNQVEASDGTTTKVVAPILAIAGTIIVVAGLFVLVRERRRRQETSRRMSNNRWDAKGSNLDLNDGTAEPEEGEDEEGETVVLDAVDGDHSCVPNTMESRLSPVDEGESSDDGAALMGEMPEHAPSDVMTEMNLTSALEDVDLDNEETGGIGELPGRHDSDS